MDGLGAVVKNLMPFLAICIAKLDGQILKLRTIHTGNAESISQFVKTLLSGQVNGWWPLYRESLSRPDTNCRFSPASSLHVSFKACSIVNLRRYSHCEHLKGESR